eukprot:scaffold209647_cov28-Tisochrysis_lutea.AAC.2
MSKEGTNVIEARCWPFGAYDGHATDGKHILLMTPPPPVCELPLSIRKGSSTGGGPSMAK